MKFPQPFLDIYFWAALICGPVFWVSLTVFGVQIQPLDRLAVHLPAILMVVLVYPVLEEIVFRGGLQEWLSSRDKSAGWMGISRANVLTSLVFAAAHFWHHPPLWAAAVFLPSLVFGFFKDRHQSLGSPIILHIFYNSGYALMFLTF